MPIDLAHDHVLSDETILEIFASTPAGPSNREYLLAIGRAIEQKVLANLPHAEPHA